MFFRKKAAKQKPAAQPPQSKYFELYRGAGYGGEPRVETIGLRFFEPDDQCEGIINYGDFTPVGGAGFSVPVPDEIIRNLTESGLTEFFDSVIRARLQDIMDCNFKITIPDALQKYVASIKHRQMK